MNILLIFNDRYTMDYNLKACVFKKIYNEYVKDIETCNFSNLSKYAAAKVKLRPFTKRKFLKELAKIDEATYFIVKE